NVSSYHLQTHLNVESLRSAIFAIALRHPILRTSFDLSHYTEPLQLVHRGTNLEVRDEDWSQCAWAEQKQRLDSFLEREQREAFDVSRPGLLRFHIHRRSEKTFQLTMTEHHAILDGWSVALLLTEIFKEYFTVAEGGKDSFGRLGSHFREYIAQERNVVQSKQAHDLWDQYLKDASHMQLRCQ